MKKLLESQILRDKNNKLSSKRVLAYLSFFVGLILTYFYVFQNKGDIELIKVFLVYTPAFEGFACSLEGRV